MIAYITGKIIHKSSDSVIIENNGIGYEIIIPLSTYYNLPDLHKDVSLYIYPHIKDETLTLFGFSTLLEKKLFLMLISVTGIGPRLAINILSGTDPEELLEAIYREDISNLCRIPGVGKKTAQRIVLELKDRSNDVFLLEKNKIKEPVLKDAISALVNLGYPEKIAEDAIKKASMRVEKLDLESLVKESLRIIAG